MADKKKDVRPFARNIAQELTSEEMEQVAGGNPHDQCHHTGTECRFSRDGRYQCDDTDECPPDSPPIPAGGFGGGS